MKIFTKIKGRLSSIIDKKHLREDERKVSFAKALAEKVIKFSDDNNNPVITYDGTILFRVTNETDIKRCTVALEDVSCFLEYLRDSYILSHKNESARF